MTPEHNHNTIIHLLEQNLTAAYKRRNRFQRALKAANKIVRQNETDFQDVCREIVEIEHTLRTLRGQN